MLLEIFASWLRSAGCTDVSLAADGEEALRRLGEVPFDLMITDVRMPNIDGITLVRRLNQVEQLLPSIIFVSGYGDFDQREMYGCGVEKFLEKPVSQDDFLEAVRVALVERDELWRNPPETAARQLMQLSTNGLSQLEAKDALRIGRGGFSASSHTPLSLGRVGFKIQISDTGREFTGHGQVRWYSRADQTVGIEIDFLDDDSREWFLSEIASANPRSYIPSH